MATPLCGRQFNSVILETQKVRSRDRQRRRQLSGVQPWNGSIHHAHPPHL